MKAELGLWDERSCGASTYVLILVLCGLVELLPCSWTAETSCCPGPVALRLSAAADPAGRGRRRQRLPCRLLILWRLVGAEEGDGLENQQEEEQ